MPFSSSKIEILNDKITFHYFHIEEITLALENIINQYIISICHGPDYQTTLLTQKKSLIALLQSKIGSNLELGCISEFFIHLYLNHQGFTQECLYENLEERGIKKGFDGYYSLNGVERLVESKSGKITTLDISHKNKINEAYNDLCNKVSGSTLDSNNQPISPWLNAYRHAKMAGTGSTIVSNINILSEQFRSGIYHNIEEFNIIPVSTVFFDGRSNPIPSIEEYEVVKNEINSWLIGKDIKMGHIICITQKTKEVLLNYLVQACLP